MGKKLHKLTEIDLLTKRAKCAHCGDVDIYVYPTGSLKCRNSKRHQTSKYRKSDTYKAKIKRNRLCIKYKLTKEELVLVKKDYCETCNSVTSLCIDHNHTTKKVRGTLCSGCNLALGHAKENAQTLRALADYIDSKNATSLTTSVSTNHLASALDTPKPVSSEVDPGCVLLSDATQGS